MKCVGKITFYKTAFAFSYLQGIAVRENESSLQAKFRRSFLLSRKRYDLFSAWKVMISLNSATCKNVTCPGKFYFKFKKSTRRYDTSSEIGTFGNFRGFWTYISLDIFKSCSVSVNLWNYFHSLLSNILRMVSLILRRMSTCFYLESFLWHLKMPYSLGTLKSLRNSESTEII